MIPSNVTVWAGNADFLTWPRGCVMAFDDARIRFLADLAKHLLAGDYSPALKALGFWLRESQLRQWQQNYQCDPQYLFAPVGKVFIVSPSNVEGLFAYSWSLSYLLGNQTVVRVSDTLTDDQQALFALLMASDKAQDDQPLQHQSFISYDKNSEWTSALSRWCQLRMLWGSDKSIEQIRSIPLSAQSQEYVFPDRYSVSVIHISQQHATDLDKLAENFARDISTYQQQACASPRWVFWYNTDTALQQRFWHLVDRRLAGVFSTNEQLVAKQYFCALGAKAIDMSHLVVISAANLVDTQQRIQGLVGQTLVEDIRDLAALLPQNLQTIAVQGLTQSQKITLANVTQVKQFSVIGSTLNFSSVWDGVDLIQTFSRNIRIGLK